MPYDNSYNRALAQRIRSRDLDYAYMNEASPLGPAFSRRQGGAHVKFNSASKTDAMDGTYYNMMPNPEAQGEGMYGGSGFASGTFRDEGFSSEPVMGAEGQGMSGGFKLSDLGNSDWWKGLTISEGKGLPQFKKAVMRGGFKLSDLGNSDWWKGLTISGGGASGGKLYEKKMKLAVMPDDMKGGTKLGLPDKLAGGALVPKAQMKGQMVSTGGKKPKTHVMPDGSVMLDSAHKGKGMSGGGKSRNEIVKAYMMKHGVKLIEASKKVKELGLYKKK